MDDTDTLTSMWREEEGKSLLLTLVLIAVLTILVSSIWALYLTQYRFLRRDAHRLQARYGAEAGVYWAIDSLQKNPMWTTPGYDLSLPGDQRSRLTIEPFGGYIFIRSESHYRRSRSVVRVLVGEAPPVAFDHAVTMWDGTSSLQVAGDTHIRGDVVVGRRGLEQSTYRRRRFTGDVDGTVHAVDDMEPPFFDEAFLQRSVTMLDSLIDAAAALDGGEEDRHERVPYWMPTANPTYVVTDDLVLTEADSALFSGPVTVVAQGNLILRGTLDVKRGSILLGGNGLFLEGGVRGRGGLFYGRTGVRIEGAVRCGGQFLSRRFVHVGASAYLVYPSMLYVTGEAIAEGRTIWLEAGAAVNGTVVHPPVSPEPDIPRGRVVIEDGALVRGGLYNAHETEFHGTLLGSLLTYQFYFYESPTSYVNWMKDSRVDVSERPIQYLVPLQFREAPELVAFHWDVHGDEPGYHRNADAR